MARNKLGGGRKPSHSDVRTEMYARLITFDPRLYYEINAVQNICGTIWHTKDLVVVLSTAYSKSCLLMTWKLVNADSPSTQRAV
jgi:hypothetical protein